MTYNLFSSRIRILSLEILEIDQFIKVQYIFITLKMICWEDKKHYFSYCLGLSRFLFKVIQAA